MMYILDLLNKIKWDQNLDPEEYTLIYFDRISNSKKEIKFSKIKDFNNLTLILEVDKKEVEIPLHRIREVKRKEKIIWKR